MSEPLVAAVDCGTNSVRLLVARRSATGLVEVDRRLHITRLGQGVDATGRFAPEALQRTFAAMRDFGEELDRLEVGLRRVVATSAARDAENSAEFFAGVEAAIGVAPEIIPGPEEARLSYLGAVRALGVQPEPVLVMDIGGGSTELVLGSGQELQTAVSLTMGSVRLRERFLAGDPPTAAELAAAGEYVDGLLTDSGVPFDQAATWVGVGGTATALSALAQQLPAYDRALVHGSVISAEALRGLADRLAAMPVSAAAALPTMQPGRADVICAGALIAARVSHRLLVPLLVSEADILDGVARELAAGAV